MKLFFYSLLFFAISSIAFSQPSITPPAGKQWVSAGVRTYTSGPLLTGGASGNTTMTCNGSSVATTCGSNDTSFGWNIQCASTPGTTLGTPGAPFIQAQKYGNIGTNNNSLAGLAVPCNPGVGGTSAGTNWPTSTSETRRVTLTNWKNDYPEVAGVDKVCIAKSAVLRFRDDGVGNGTGAGADELRLTIVGGTAGACASWKIDYSYNLAISVSGAYGSISGVNGTKINQTVTQNLSNIPAAGSGNAYNATDNVNHSASCGSFQSSVNSWYFPSGTNTASFGTGYTNTHNILSSLVTNGSTFDVDFTSQQSIAIDRTATSGSGDGGDARATGGPGMGGKVELVVEYECWIASSIATPVTLKSFTVTPEDGKVLLAWQTSNEINNSHFEIEKSTDAKVFSQVGVVKGQVNSGEENRYAFTDDKPFIGLNYYRLRQVDLDGKFEYSKIRSVNVTNSTNLEISPNPTQDYIIFRGLEENSLFEIVDANGKTMYNTKIEGTISELQLSVNNYPSGLYFVRTQNKDKRDIRRFYVY